ncbi:protein kinase [Streptomyces stramineus]
MSEAEQTQGTAGRLLAGRYRLGDVLGRGGMGTVWRATDETLGRTVAVKELRFPANIDEDEKRRLITRTLREAKAIARIRSAGAVTVYDVVHEDDRPWIVMELIEGRSLADVIREDGPLKWRRAAEVGLAVLDVLGAAHRQGILHRDVKPSNVLIAEDGRVVLTDFGIAQVEGDPSVTSTGMLVGAPSYISPERARGQKPGPPADLWSLGGLLYAAVEGAPPYDKGSAIATLTAVMTEPLGPPKNAGPLAEVMYGLLAKDPEKRLNEAGARALLNGAVHAPDERIPRQASPARDVDATQAMAIPVIPEAAAASRPAAKAGAGTSAKAPVKPSVKPAQQRTTGSGSVPGRSSAASRGAGQGMNSYGTDAQRGRGIQPARWEKASVLEVVPRRTLIVVAVVVVLAVIGTVLAIALSGGDEGDKGGKAAGAGKPAAVSAPGQDAGHKEPERADRSFRPEGSNTSGGAGEQAAGQDSAEQDGAEQDSAAAARATGPPSCGSRTTSTTSVSRCRRAGSRPARRASIPGRSTALRAASRVCRSTSGTSRGRTPSPHGASPTPTPTAPCARTRASASRRSAAGRGTTTRPSRTGPSNVSRTTSASRSSTAASRWTTSAATRSWSPARRTSGTRRSAGSCARRLCGPSAPPTDRTTAGRTGARPRGFAGRIGPPRA